MTKRILSLLLAVLMLTGVSLAETVYTLPETEESASLTYEEMEIYLASLVKAAQADPELDVTQTSQYGHSWLWASFRGGVLEIEEEQLTEDSIAFYAELSAEQADPRGLYLGDSLQQLLTVYPSDNPDLLGSYYDATLYVSGEKPEVCVGWLLRDGQRVTEVVYTVYRWQEDGVACLSIRFMLDQGVITGILIGPRTMYTEEEALEEIGDIADSQEITDYFAYPQSEYGPDLGVFQREDLSFSGVDFLDLTAESALNAFGTAAEDAWTQDSTGEWLRILHWDGVSLILVYDVNRQFIKVDSLTVSADVLEGPRGVRVGDYLDTVIFRFRHSEGGFTDTGMTMYGDGETPPYGLLAYDAEGAALTYALSLEDGETVLWYLTFIGARLDSMRLLLR